MTLMPTTIIISILTLITIITEKLKTEIKSITLPTEPPQLLIPAPPRIQPMIIRYHLSGKKSVSASSAKIRSSK